jgi:glycopeptide antibiotics resistance protein
VVTVGGVGVMVLGAAVSGLVLWLAAWAMSRRLGWVTALAVAGLVWSLVVIALVTLVPTSPDTGWVARGEAQTTCSFDYGGPAPEGFWIFSGTQRMLNAALFVPSGVLVVLAVARWPRAWRLAPLGLLALAAYSVGIEAAQLALARIDRACDITDVVDNVTGAALGFLAGLLLAAVLQPWRRRGAVGAGR